MGKLGCVVTVIFAVVFPATASALTFSPRATIAPGHRLNAVACPSATFCLAVGSGGDAVSTTHPASAWTQRRIGGGQTLSAVACPSTRLCVVLGTRGRVLSGSGKTWRTARLALPKHASLTAIACPARHLCVVTDSRGGVFTATNPASGWHRHAAIGQALGGVSCASMRLCVATTRTRRVLVSTRPAGAWHSLRVLAPGDFDTNAFDAVACPAANLCLGAASDGFGASTVVTHSPTAARAWTTLASYSSPEPRTNLVASDVACGSPHTCAAYTVDQFGSSVLYAYSLGTTSATGTATGTMSNLTDIACARTLCVAIDRRGGAIVGR